MASIAGAQVPGLINYQGRLLDDTNLYSGAVRITFEIYTNVAAVLPVYVSSDRAKAFSGEIPKKPRARTNDPSRTPIPFRLIGNDVMTAMPGTTRHNRTTPISSWRDLA